jgi:hypothetical protein
MSACPRCHYIGNRHLCGCIGTLGNALRQGDLDEARRLYQSLVDAANRDEQSRLVTIEPGPMQGETKERQPMTLIRDHRLLILALLVGLAALLAVVLLDHATAGDLARSSWGKLAVVLRSRWG